MKLFVCIALLAIGIADAEQNKAFRERAEIYSSNVLIFFCFVSLNSSAQLFYYKPRHTRTAIAEGHSLTLSCLRSVPSLASLPPPPTTINSVNKIIFNPLH